MGAVRKGSMSDACNHRWSKDGDHPYRRNGRCPSGWSFSCCEKHCVPTDTHKRDCGPGQTCKRGSCGKCRRAATCKHAEPCKCVEKSLYAAALQYAKDNGGKLHSSIDAIVTKHDTQISTYFRLEPENDEWTDLVNIQTIKWLFKEDCDYGHKLQIKQGESPVERCGKFLTFVRGK